MNQSELFTETPPAKVNRLAVALVATCQRCKCTEYVDHRLMHPPHNGRSVRRDCARCQWTLGFPEWYGEKTEATA